MAQASITRAGFLETYAAQYEFAVHGGAISTIGLRVNLPTGAIVVSSSMEVLTIPVGVGASIAVQIEAANDVIAVAAIIGAPWSTTGFKAGVSDWLVANFKKCTANRELKVVITGAALTAGKFNIFLHTMRNTVA